MRQRRRQASPLLSTTITPAASASRGGRRRVCVLHACNDKDPCCNSGPVAPDGLPVPCAFASWSDVPTACLPPSWTRCTCEYYCIKRGTLQGLALQEVFLVHPVCVLLLHFGCFVSLVSALLSSSLRVVVERLDLQPGPAAFKLLLLCLGMRATSCRFLKSTDLVPGSPLTLAEVFSNNDEGLINKKLPKELLLRIFSFLDIVTLCRCAQISKAWNILALDGSNWQRIDLFNFQTDVEGRVVENISKRCGGFLRKLSLRGCIGVGDSSLKTFAQNCRNIEHLNLNGCTKITDSTCYSLSRFCSKLKHLDLTSCVSITNSSLKGISEGCRNLEYLNLSWCDQITKDGIEALVRGCRGLKALLLRGCTQLEDEALKHIQNYCHELVSLNLQSCSGTAVLRTVPEAEVCQQKKVKSVHHKVCFLLLTSHYLFLPCASHPRILEAARCSHLTDAGFTLLARNCHDLEKMDLEECVLITDSTLIQLSVHCPKLQALSLSHCELITDDGILHLSNSTCGHERLRVLELDNCLLITDVALEHLENCRGLERLELYDCQQVTRAGIKRMRAQLPHVKVHAYFAPVTPPTAVGGSGQRLCRCCVIL
ncbi:F-box/LRR-repeat protein 2 [Puma concolor]|uniref:F-box/LRR-repeat protein 2 n=1 Tax=Puma concolor TaxID=9696 RepID=A0A6P6H280_PUMCO|nr:F-box/LRR-repeat protein 2 [Puma concolor]